MAKEIERKFLVDKNLWKPSSTVHIIKQVYLTADKRKVIRVRTSDNLAYLTLKSVPKSGITRDEFEYEIPMSDALQLFDLSEGHVISKKRHIYNVGNKIWEVDEFEGDNQGLIIAEIELESENETFEQPSWAKTEVSTDTRYYNFNLSRFPYKNWEK